MRLTFILCVVLTFLLGFWQIKRFLTKLEFLHNLEHCSVTKLESFDKYCNFTGGLLIQKDNTYFLYKDEGHFYVLVSGFTDREVFLVNIGYIKKSLKKEVLDIINKDLKLPKEMNLSGYILPIGKMRIPFIRNDLSNSELYSLNPEELRGSFNVPLSNYMIYSTENDVVKTYPEVFFKLARPTVRTTMHLWYAIMWCSISGFGLIYYLYILRKSKKK